MMLSISDTLKQSLSFLNWKCINSPRWCVVPSRWGWNQWLNFTPHCTSSFKDKVFIFKVSSPWPDFVFSSLKQTAESLNSNPGRQALPHTQAYVSSPWMWSPAQWCFALQKEMNNWNNLCSYYTKTKTAKLNMCYICKRYDILLFHWFF